jgi:hypothetical protein
MLFLGWVFLFKPTGNISPLESATSTSPFSSLDWQHYHNYSEIVEVLFSLNASYPAIVDVFSIGTSWWGRDIYCVRLTNESNVDPKPEVFFVGYHHTREPISAELPLYFLVYAAENFGLNSTVTYILNNCEIYVLVALNVDGFDLFQANDWQRKNARPVNEDSDGLFDEDPPEDENENGFVDQLIDYSVPGGRFIRWEGMDNDGDSSYGEDWVGGVDLNRNYNYSWEGGVSDPKSEIYKGPFPFSEPETQALRDFVLDHDFPYALSYHSGTELILYPWGHTTNPSPDEAEFIEISADLSNITQGTPYEQASLLYRTYGVWDDWMYGVGDVKAFTCEVFTNETWSGVAEPGPDPDTVWEGGLKYWFNPFPQAIETVILRWLPTFFYIAERAVNEFTHDIAVMATRLEKHVVGSGHSYRLNITVRNEGGFDETANLRVYMNSSLASEEPLNLSRRSTEIIPIVCNMSAWIKGNYSITVEASPVPEEIDILDNSFIDGWIFVSIPGDVDLDKDVDIFDIVVIAVSYGFSIQDPQYNPDADINDNEEVDIFDVVLAVENYGEDWLPS